MSHTYLLEIGTEELPAGHIPEARRRLAELLGKALGEHGIEPGSINTLATPRRLTALIEGLPARQPDREEKRKGPPVDRCFDAEGKPNKALLGFAEKSGLRVDRLEKENIGGTEYMVANLLIKGRETSLLLSEIVPPVIAQISGERLMRWGDSSLKFSRPIRWLVSLLDREVVPFKMENIEAGRTTHGHRILAPAPIDLASPDEYEPSLERGKVLVDPEKRRKLIEEQVTSLAASVQGEAGRLSRGALLDEVVNITEWPRALMGNFSDDYLALPDKLLETIMVHHQRYFPVERSGSSSDHQSATANNLLPHFITVANNDVEAAQKTIRQGNERVLKARLADGKFFYFDDQKVKLTERLEALGQLTYQHGLGSYLDKRHRLVELAASVSSQLGLDSKHSVCLEETMKLCKLDLVTNLVGELPELQGYVGAWYAELEGMPEQVVTAIASHYSPRHNDDGLPGDMVGALAAVLDKLDHVTGLFCLGKRPSGSSDPFALRRNAQGLIDILMDGPLANQRLDLEALIDELLDRFEPMVAGRRSKKEKEFDRQSTRADLVEFLSQRLRARLLESGHRREIIDAVMSAGRPMTGVADTTIRLKALEELIEGDSSFALVRAGVRLGNILKPDSPSAVDESKISQEAEKTLWSKYKEIKPELDRFEPTGIDQYRHLIASLKPLSAPVDGFFEKVMVNDEDEGKRLLRHGILKNVYSGFEHLADFTRLQPLLPS